MNNRCQNCLYKSAIFDEPVPKHCKFRKSDYERLKERKTELIVDIIMVGWILLLISALIFGCWCMAR